MKKEKKGPVTIFELSEDIGGRKLLKFLMEIPDDNLPVLKDFLLNIRE